MGSVVLLILLTPGIAVAATTFSAHAPTAITASQSVANVRVSAYAVNPAYIRSASLLVDGVARPTYIAFAGYWDGDDCDTWFVEDRTQGTAYCTIPALAVGTHAVELRVTSQTGAVDVTNWSISVAPPSTQSSSAAPAAASTATVRNPQISLYVTDQVSLNYSAAVYVDGVRSDVGVLFEPFGVTYWEWEGWTYEGETGPIDTTRGRVVFTPSSLSDGTHTVRVDIGNATGRTASYTWSFSVAAPPVVGALTPANGSSVGDLLPWISAAITDNTDLSSTTMEVDGLAVDATFTDGVLTYLPADQLSNDNDHSVRVTAVDAGGLTTVSQWTFGIQVYPDMPVSSTCEDCHDPWQHPMDDCNACHNTVPGVGHGLTPAPASRCTQCHHVYSHGPAQIVPGVTWGGGDEPQEGYTGYWGRYCTTCHQAAYPTIPKHSADNALFHETAQDVEPCAPCHVRALTREHFRYSDETGQPFDCDTCHASSDPDVVAAIEQQRTACPACHTTASGDAGHPHAPAHFEAYTDDCAGCHSNDLVGEHAKADSSSATSGCDACHGEGNPRSSFTTWDGGCSQGGCHAEGTDQERHASAAASHAVPAAYATCTGCHFGADVSEIHSGALVLTAEGEQRSCDVCHGGATPPVGADCSLCHPDRLATHGYDPPTHTSNVAASTITGVLRSTSGAAFYFFDGSIMSFGGQTCGQCHMMDLAAEHTKPTSNVSSQNCAACHASPRDSFTTWNDACQQGGCHVTMHTDMATKHYQNYIGRDPSCGYGLTACHGTEWKKDVAAVHNQAWLNGGVFTDFSSYTNGCTLCHSVPWQVPAPKTGCNQCHVNRHGAAPLQ